ncbi:glycoside hydrolase family 15 protein [Candidatus Ferrigenium straubiae]|jgi:glucoamylase|uniref:glycoside hydrolase family 15 protein n=1 Tax=Candidatus Ferrigenium straubiae TaxID=2919506 RepID=UPI003F4A9F6A
MKAPPAGYSCPTWAPAAKDMVGTSLGSSRVWFTLAEGIVTEVYYPRIDIPQIKDIGFIIADDMGFWVELRRLGSYVLKLPSPAVPAVEVVHTHPRFTFTLQVCPSQRRDVLMLRLRLEGDANLRLYALLAPRLGADGERNVASVEKHNGRTVLCAEQGPFGLALAAAGDGGEDVWQRCSAGSIEESDGWQDFNRNGRMTWEYDSAGPGAVALTGELPVRATLALGLGTSKGSAATLAVANLMEDFSSVWDAQCRAWQTWLSGCRFPRLPPNLRSTLELSAMVLKVHQDRTYCGAVVASLSVPWGENSVDRSGYHLVWSRDLVETAGAMVAMQSYDDARDVLRYLIATQQEDGHWLQNQWLGGTAHWQGIQLDEAAFPVILVSLLDERNALNGIPVKDMVRRALRFIAREGPVTGQDRWEEDPGVNTFTLAIAIAALVEGSAFLDERARRFALLLADNWNAHVEQWTYAEDTELSRRLGVGGYYIRTAPVDALVHEGAKSEEILIKNRVRDPFLPANQEIATDFLQLVRYGLRRADDPRILETLKAADQLLKTDTPNGPVWHRYNGDGYGEHEDGSAFDGSGRGRGWPLLTGERGHYALVAGADPIPYLEAMAAMTGAGGLIPEQVWDSPAITERKLEPGKPSGGAMPLIWAHSEFIKLCYSHTLGYPVDRPAATWNRYMGKPLEITHHLWGPRYRPRRLKCGNRFTIALRRPALVHWGINGWNDARDSETDDTGLGVWAAEIPVAGLSVGDSIQFTFYWRDDATWEGSDYEAVVCE